MVVLGLGLGLLLQNLTLVVQNGVPTRLLGAATSAAQFSRTIGGTIGVTVMGAVLTSRLPSGAGSLLSGGGVAGANPGSGTGVGRERLAEAIHPVFVIGIPLMALAFCAATLIPELPLRRSVRDDATAAPAPERDPVPQDPVAA